VYYDLFFFVVAIYKASERPASGHNFRHSPEVLLSTWAVARRSLRTTKDVMYSN